MDKFKQILKKGTFQNKVNAEVLLTLKSKIEKSKTLSKRKAQKKMELNLDFTALNQEIIARLRKDIKFPSNLPKGVIIAIKKGWIAK
jgi:hypothetical protein